MNILRSSVQLCLVGVMSFGLIGCETKAGTGALVGGAGGAALGGIIGNNTGHGHTAGGALIGGAVGAIGGGLVGNGMDQQDKKEAKRRDREYESDYDRRNSNSSGQQWREQVTKSDVMAWTSQGVRDDIIVDRINRSGAVFKLSASDQNKLRDEGVSEEVIRAMKDTQRR